MKHVLMIAYHFPPMRGSSGIQRTLRFARYLLDFGWKPIVLTAHLRAYEDISLDQLKDIPAGVEVIRAPAWDTARHFSLGGRYPRRLACPDRWASWYLGAVPVGLRLIRRLKPAAIWSTYPIATAHRIAAVLQTYSGLPWIADFRDPMAQEGYPEDPIIWRSFARIEARAIGSAAASCFTSPSAVRLYTERYPNRANRMVLIENGYDEHAFSDALSESVSPLNPGNLTLLHSGIIYPSERDPTQLFAALASLRTQYPAVYDRIVIRFRAPAHPELLADLGERYGVLDKIQVCAAVGYRDALTEMMRADALLILQASNCNAQIPAKLYEYFRARRPLIVLTDPDGDTAITCRKAGIDTIARLDDAADIAQCLARFCSAPHEASLATERAIMDASRYNRTRELAHLLDDVVSCR